MVEFHGHPLSLFIGNAMKKSKFEFILERYQLMFQIEAKQVRLDEIIEACGGPGRLTEQAEKLEQEIYQDYADIVAHRYEWERHVSTPWTATQNWWNLQYSYDGF